MPSTVCISLYVVRNRQLWSVNASFLFFSDDAIGPDSDIEMTKTLMIFLVFRQTNYFDLFGSAAIYYLKNNSPFFTSRHFEES